MDPWCQSSGAVGPPAVSWSISSGQVKTSSADWYRHCQVSKCCNVVQMLSKFCPNVVQALFRLLTEHVGRSEALPWTDGIRRPPLVRHLSRLHLPMSWWPSTLTLEILGAHAAPVSSTFTLSHDVSRFTSFHIASHLIAFTSRCHGSSQVRCKASNIRAMLRLQVLDALLIELNELLEKVSQQRAKPRNLFIEFLLTVLTGLFAVILLLYAVMNSSFRSMTFYECYTVVSWSDCFSTEIQHGFNVVLTSSCVLRWFRALFVLYRFSMALYGS